MFAGAGVAQDHVGFADAAEIAEGSKLPIQTDHTRRSGVGDAIVADVIEQSPKNSMPSRCSLNPTQMG